MRRPVSGRDAVRSEVIDVVEAQIKRRPAMKKVSTAATKQSRNFSEQKLTIGLDLGDRSSHYCVLDESGGILVESKVSHEPQCDAGGVRVDAAESHCFGDGDALPVGKPAAERIGARSDRGPCTQRALDRGEPAQRRSPGCADSGSSGADRSTVAVSGEASQCESTGRSDGDPSASRAGASADGAGEYGPRTGEILWRAAARM